MVKQRELVGAHSSHILGTDGQPVLRRHHDWKGLELERKEIPVRAECGPQFSGVPVVVASQYSPGRRWYRCNGKIQEIPMIAPGVDTLGAAYERDAGRWECEPGGESICLRLHPDTIRRYLQEDAYHFDLETKYSSQDDVLVRTIYVLADEIQNGFPNGKLYAEGMSLSIIGWLCRHHASKPAQPSPQNRGLSPAQQARVRELVDTFLDSELSVERMAAEVGISPFHFSRLFRTTFGMPPYRYVLQMRIARAAHLLRAERQRTVADIALDVGFASQAHLTHAFKSHMGQTPARWRVA
jgi:AraC family transcriptional regulator